MPNNTQFSMPLNKPETLSYNIDSGSDLARVEFTEPYGTDFIFYYKDMPLFGGMHTEVNVNDIDENQLDIAGQGWLHYLERRIWPPVDGAGNDLDPYVALDRDIFKIAEDLVGTVAAGLFSFSNGLCGQLMDFHIEKGDTQTILAQVDTVAKIFPGFDFEITWDKQYKMYSPHQGSYKTYVFEQGSNCGPIGYRNPGLGGNFFWGTGSGSGGGRAASWRFDDSSMLHYRRHDVTKDFGEVSSPEALDVLAAGEAPRQAIPLKQISLTWMGDAGIDNIFEEVWRGDTVRVIGDTGYEFIDDLFRIVNIEGNPTDEDDESLTFTFDDGTLSL